MAIHFFIIIFVVLITPILCYILYAPLCNRNHISIYNSGYIKSNINPLEHDRINMSIPVIFFFVISIIFFMGFRNGGGIDDESYKLFYESEYGRNSWIGVLSQKEPIFILFSNISKHFGINYKGLFLLYAIFQGFFLFKALKNYFINPWEVSLFVAGYFFFVYSSSFTVMRQASAMVIIFYYYSLSNIKKRKWGWALAILSFICHYGAIIAILIEAIRKIFFNKLKLGVIWKIGLPLVCLALSYIINFQNILQYITAALNMYSYMQQSENYLADSKLGRVAFVAFVIYCFLLIYENISKKKIDDNTENIHFIQMLYFSLTFLTAHLRWGSRIQLYSIMFLPFLLIDISKLFKNKIIVMFTFCVILVLGTIYIFSYIDGIANYQWSVNFI